MYGLPTSLMPTGLVHDTSSSSSSVKSGKSGKSNSKPASGTFSQYNSNASITTVNTSSGSDTIHYGHKMRSGSISSGFPGGPPSPTQQFHNNSHSIANGNGYASRPGLMGSLAEEHVYHHHIQHQQPDVPLPSQSGDYTQCLQWLQQTCRPVLMKELEQPSNVPVPLTAANAKHPSQIGGIQHVQIASWKQSQVQLLPIDRWGQPQDVLAEIQALHRLRKCRQIIQLYGYLPNAMMPSGQMPALLLQQPSYGSLRQFLDHHFESIHWPERYKLALDMAQGLRYLTVQDIPCTLHSGNILVDAEGVAVLTGFGSATGMVASAPCQMTAQPSPSALLVYMAPERLSGRGPHSPDWELFSLGILLWELSSGRIPFDEIIARAEAGPRLGKNMEQLSSAIVKGLREETIPGTPDIYEQLFKMCWDSDAEARPPLEVVEETLQMLVVVEPMDMLMLPGEEMSMPVSTILSDSIDGDSFGSQTATRSNSIRSVSPGPNQTRSGHVRPTTLHQAISVSNADMTEWFILSGHDLNGYAIVPTYSLECEITPIQTCLGHFLPTSLPIFKELMEQEVDTKLLVKRSLQNCLHVLLDRYIPFRNDNGSAHLFAALDMLLATDINLNAQDVQGYTPLHLLMRNPKISSEDVAEVLKRMVLKGADTSIQAPRDGNVLSLAAKYLHFEAAKYILNRDPTASDPESIDKAIESCMTMTGRQTDKFVNLRTKLRELLKLWTGQAAAARREKVVLRTLQDAGQMDSSGMRLKTKVVHLAPQAQLDYANKYYDSHIKKQREKLFANIGMLPGMAR